MTGTNAPSSSDARSGSHGGHLREIPITCRVLLDGDERFHFKLPENAPLLDVLVEGAGRAGVKLLPNEEQPLDRLHNLLRHHEVGPAIGDLEQSLEQFLDNPDATPDFGIELVLAFHVNTRWAVAPATELSPRQILELPEVNLNFQDYTLYLPNSTEPLPLDTPITIERGMLLEAQRDGKYGAGPE